MSFVKTFISILSTWALLFVIYVNGHEKPESKRSRSELRAEQTNSRNSRKCIDPRYKLESQVGKDCSRLESQAELR